MAYLVFGSANSHPLAWLLNKRHRHVWCICADRDQQTWVSYNWAKGLPVLRTEASLDFDIAAHYEAQGFDVVRIPDADREAVQGPLVLNNCVGQAKSVLGIRGFSISPHQLYNQVVRRQQRKARKVRKLNIVTAPGHAGDDPMKFLVDPLHRKYAPPEVVDPANVFGERDLKEEKEIEEKMAAHQRAQNEETRRRQMEEVRAQPLLQEDQTNNTLLS